MINLFPQTIPFVILLALSGRQTPKQKTSNKNDNLAQLLKKNFDINSTSTPNWLEAFYLEFHLPKNQSTNKLTIEKTYFTMNYHCYLLVKDKI